MVRIATETLRAIENAMLRDQGNAFRAAEQRWLPQMDDAYRQNNSGFRAHLGASLIGRECAREIWYGFRWAQKPEFDGRMLRLFNRGHLEEARFCALLEMIGCKLFQSDENGKQYRISDVDGHFGGSGDGIALGVPDLPANEYCLLEFKTHSDKSFVKLTENGVSIAKPEHFVQMQVYMYKMGLEHALYMAVNKNNDDIYAEIIAKNEEVGRAHVDRARTIIYLQQPPRKLSEKSSFFKCKFCDKRDICHNGKPMARNCRTCVHASPVADGQWKCGYHNAVIPAEFIEQTCDQWKQID